MSLAYAISHARGPLLSRRPRRLRDRVDESVRHEHSLLDLDGLHEGDHPALHPLAGDHATLLYRLEAAVDRLLDLCGYGLALELLLADALG
jgi:hypothetical protein